MAGKSGRPALGILFLVAAGAIALEAQTFTTLVRFDGTDGAAPSAALTQGTDGNLYGTTYGGGTGNAPGGGGTIFRISPGGALTTIYDFCSQGGDTCTDGDGPAAGFVQASSGNFYGTTQAGGTHYSAGTIYKVSTGGILTTLYDFCVQINCADGEFPVTAFVEAVDQDLYGTVNNGVGGFIFKMTPQGASQRLHQFSGVDGAIPNALIQAADGNFYGTTQSGGVNCAPGGCGTVFKMTPSGVLATLYNFCSVNAPDCTDGREPGAALVEARDGDFYGTTTYGGAAGYGTVFKITPYGSLTTLHSFCATGGCTEGGNPEAALIQATDGNFYGTTYRGGANGGGTIFQITPGGRLTTLYHFCSEDGLNCTDGGYSTAGLLQATDGVLYGTTYFGGVTHYCPTCGTVFSLSMGLGPFVKAQPTAGRPGASVTILGTDLAGATTVGFNGTPASFKVISSSEITTTVPAGATTGTVAVVTPAGTLSSDVSFHVR